MESSTRTTTTTITATKAAKTFGDLLNRIEYQGAHYLVERNGRRVCEMRPAPPRATVADLVAFFRTGPRPDPGWADDVEAYVGSQEVAVPRSPWDAP